MGSVGTQRVGGSSATAPTRNVDEEVRLSSDYVGQREVENQINEQLRYNLGDGEEYASVASFRIISNPGGGEMGDVEATYQVTVRIPYEEYDSDGYSQTYYDTEYEYRTDTFQVRLKRRR